MERQNSFTAARRRGQEHPPFALGMPLGSRECLAVRVVPFGQQLEAVGNHIETGDAPARCAGAFGPINDASGVPLGVGHPFPECPLGCGFSLSKWARIRLEVHIGEKSFLTCSLRAGTRSLQRNSDEEIVQSGGEAANRRVVVRVLQNKAIAGV